jgi:hypothetical protein
MRKRKTNDSTMKKKKGLYRWINKCSFSIDEIDFIFKLELLLEVVAPIEHMKLKIKKKVVFFFK